ncbi:MAG: urea carboxylase-associated family protein [Thermomicrobiales bacterium]|nr:urea carboxylase-associated family protein [Thermomicrobiales bacterium]
MSDLLNEKTPIKSRHIRPGQGEAVEVKAGQFLQIETLQGKQVADFVAFSLDDTGEFLSTAATRSTNGNIVPQLGMTLYSNRREPMFEIVEDTVGRHDMLYACCDPVRYEKLGAPGHANCREALTASLVGYGIGYDRIPDPINWFMTVSIQQRGELEIREPIAEAGDYVLVKALKDVVAAVSACPQDLTPTNAEHPTNLRVRVFRDEPLPAMTMREASQPVAEAEIVVAEVVEPEPAEAAVEAAPEPEPATVEAAPEPAPATEAAEQGAPSTVASSHGPSRPARLRDTAEATVVRVE